ncbi:hypothetical protein [Anoxybacteroides rupiense]|uniref:hypothetical protein n=1 Tax=Anoxybacteroides rupiense TaxID=311460 RepID=UPI003FA5937E
MENQNLKFTDEAVKLVQVIGDRRYSSTQAVKTLLIEKNGEKYISLQKWWRKFPDEPWQEGKGFHMSPEEAKDLRNSLMDALKFLKESK